MKVKPGVREFLNRFNDICGVIAGVFILSFVLFVAYSVVLRYFFNSPIIWADEVLCYMTVYAVFMAVAYTAQVKGHIGVDIIVTNISPGKQNILGTVTSFLALIYWAVITWQGAKLSLMYLQAGVRSETMLAAPLFFPTVIVPIGSFFMCIQAIAMVYDHMSQLSSRAKP